MIGLDTNVLVRYIAEDNPKEAARATKIIETLSKDEPGFICSIVLVELCWVLTRCYKVGTEDLMLIVRALLQAEDLNFEHREEAWKAHQIACAERLDFADALLGLIHHKHGCVHTVTFDKKANSNSFFKAA